DELRRIGRSAAAAVSIRRMPGSAGLRVVESRAAPGFSNLSAGGVDVLVDTLRTHEVGVEQADSAPFPVGGAAWIILEIPVVKRQLRVDLPQQLFEAVGELTMPGQKLRTAVHVRRLVDFVLLEPPTHSTGRCIGSAARIIPF